MSFAIRFLFVITFLWKEKILLGRLNVLVNVKQEARFLAGIGRAYLGIGSDVSDMKIPHGYTAGTHFSMFC